LVSEKVPQEIDQTLMNILMAPLEQASRHGLWGVEAQRISKTGQWLGWVPSHLPFLFFADTVCKEIANGYASHGQKAEGQREDRRKSESLLHAMALDHLAQRNPYTLSQGESKLIWFLTQWAKQPEYLVISDLKGGLSVKLQDRLLQFIMEQTIKFQLNQTVILGVTDSDKSWKEKWVNQGWKHVTGFLSEI